MRTARGLRLPGAPAVPPLSLGALLLCGGCCSSPDPYRYFDRLDPFTTVNGFVYAVEAKRWDFAYDCLSAESRKAFTQGKLQVVIQWFSHPEYGISIRDIILNTERERNLLALKRTGIAEWPLFSEVEHPDGYPVGIRLPLYLVAEERDGRILWLMDLDRTIQQLNAAGGGAPQIP